MLRHINVVLSINMQAEESFSMKFISNKNSNCNKNYHYSDDKARLLLSNDVHHHFIVEYHMKMCSYPFQ